MGGTECGGAARVHAGHDDRLHQELLPALHPGQGVEPVVVWNPFMFAALCCTLQYCTMLLYDILQYGTVRYSTVQYGTVRYSTVQFSTFQYCTVLYLVLQNSLRPSVIASQVFVAEIIL